MNIRSIFIGILGLMMFDIESVSAAKKKSVVENIKYLNSIYSQEYSAPMSERSAERGSAQPVNEVLLNTRCQLRFANFEDLRQNKETFGFDGSDSIPATNIADWLIAAEQDIWSARVKFSEGGKVIFLRPKLHRLYSYPSSINVDGIVSISVDFEVDGKILGSFQSRGFSARMRVFNSISDFHNAMTYALHDAMYKTLLEFESVCDRISSNN